MFFFKGDNRVRVGFVEFFLWGIFCGMLSFFSGGDSVKYVFFCAKKWIDHLCGMFFFEKPRWKWMEICRQNWRDWTNPTIQKSCFFRVYKPTAIQLGVISLHTLTAPNLWALRDILFGWVHPLTLLSSSSVRFGGARRWPKKRHQKGSLRCENLTR